MIKKLFPRRADGDYQGSKLAAALLAAFAAKSLVAAGIHMFAKDGGAQSIASVALDTFSAEAADSVVTMFGLWGVEQAVIGLIAVAVLLRYRSLIPLMAAAYVLEYAGRFAAPLFTPGLSVVHAPPGAVADKVLLPLAVVMAYLSLRGPKPNRNAVSS